MPLGLFHGFVVDVVTSFRVLLFYFMGFLLVNVVSFYWLGLTQVLIFSEHHHSRFHDGLSVIAVSYSAMSFRIWWASFLLAMSFFEGLRLALQFSWCWSYNLGFSLSHDLLYCWGLFPCYWRRFLGDFPSHGTSSGGIRLAIVAFHDFFEDLVTTMISFHDWS